MLFLPFFLSWVIISRLGYSVLHPESGIVNMVSAAFGGEHVFFMVKSALFPLIVVVAGAWQSSGFTAIIYLAVISTIDPSLYESAEIDGASGWQKTRSITLPLLVPQILVMLLLSIGNFLNTGYNQIQTLYNPLVRSTGEILVNYIFNVGINRGRFSFATAVGMFQAIVGVVLVLGGHLLALRLTGRGSFYVPRSNRQASE